MIVFTPITILLLCVVRHFCYFIYYMRFVAWDYVSSSLKFFFVFYVSCRYITFCIHDNMSPSAGKSPPSSTRSCDIKDISVDFSPDAVEKV